MRKLHWGLSIAGVLGFMALGLTLHYGARHPESLPGRLTCAVASLGARFNPFVLLSSTAPREQGCPCAMPRGGQVGQPEPVAKADDGIVIEAPQVVGIVKLDVNPIEPPPTIEIEIVDPPLEPVFPVLPPIPATMPRADDVMPSCPERASESPRRMPYAGQESMADETDCGFWGFWGERVVPPMTEVENPFRLPRVKGDVQMPDLREDPALHLHYHGCPHMGCPYPSHYYRPTFRPVELPATNNPAEQFKKSMRLLGLWLNPWLYLQQHQAPSRSDVDTMEFRPEDANGLPLTGRKF